MIVFPSIDEALELHRQVVERFGGGSGVRDVGLLESALYRPQSGYYNDLADMAAALMESLIINHPFVDGNKRVAFFLTDTFLRLNGYKIKITPRSGHRFIIGLMTRSKDRFKRIQVWLKRYVIKL